MKKISFLWLLPLMMCSACHTEAITIRYQGATAEVQQKATDSVTVVVNGAQVTIESQYKNRLLTLRLTGTSDDGQLVLKSAGKARVTLDGLTLASQEGAPLCLKNKKKVVVVAANRTENTLTVTACLDTANHKAAVIWAKDKLLLSGKGTLNVIATGDGCRGIKTKKDLTIEGLTLLVETSGDNLGEKPLGPPGFGGEMPDFGGDGEFPFPDFGQGGPPDFGGEFPFPDFGGEMPDFGGEFPFPDFGEGMPDFGQDGPPDFGGGFGGKHKYVSATKGITSKGKITINSGNVTVRTSTAGAEGIEGKEGIVFNGGNVDVLATDDAINAGACIEFNGADVTARSTGNDAVDANPQSGFFSPFGSNEQSNEPAIVIRGGTVYAWSQVGSPEEGLDCDFAAIIIEGGNVFSVGGGMGEMPSVPTDENAKQPTVLLIGIGIVQDEPVQIYDGSGRLIHTVSIPFSLRRSASLVSSPAFKVGNTYTVKTKDYEKTFILTTPFTPVR